MKDKEIEKAKMKTLEESLLAEVKIEGYDDIQDWLLNAGTYNHEAVILGVMKKFACEVLDYAAEKARTIGVNCDGELINKSSILNIKEELK